MRRRGTSDGFTALRVEGAILPSNFLVENVATQKAEHQKASDYGLSKSFALRDEIARCWSMALDLFEVYESQRHRAMHGINGVGLRDWPIPLLRKVLGYEDLETTRTVQIEERFYPLTHRVCAGTVPMLLTTWNYGLDRTNRQFGHEGRREAPHSLMQEFLNAEDKCLWGIVSNGLKLRLLRDNVSLTRPAFIEADLATMFREGLYSDFAALWLVVHASRLRPVDGQGSSCILETWRTQAHDAGERALDQMRTGVTEALRQLGNGFLQHESNRELRERINAGELRSESYYEQLLRMVYRLLFLFTTEERDLLHSPEAGNGPRRIYQDGYSLARLRERALQRRHYDRHGDLWDGLRIVFRALRRGEPALGLPALGGLFDEGHCPDLDGSAVANRNLLETVRSLSYFHQKSVLVRINYRDMGTEELGSVYESLLELNPVIDVARRPWRFKFSGDDSANGGKGYARKLTGSYYTPADLVRELIRSALEPVLKQAVRDGRHDPRKAILDLRVIDPACGSGHFLLAAARRMASELASLEAGFDAPDESTRRTAFREVVQNCIYGVDRNPLAVELCRTALWIEAVEPGKPLTFLDPHIQHGNSLIGILDPDVMKEGIPTKAYTPLTGDDRKVCTALRKRNKQSGRAVQGDLFDEDSLEDMATAQADFDHLPEDTIEEIARKREAWNEARSTERHSPEKLKANLFTGAFFVGKTRDTARTVPVTEDLNREAKGIIGRPGVEGRAADCARRHGFFHWHTAFAEVMGRGGGFDVVLSNPPWERIKLQEKEFFATRSPRIANARIKAERQRLIDALAGSDASSADRALHREFHAARREAEAASQFLRGSGRFRLTNYGDINTYAVFAETCLDLLHERGRAGVIVPTGIATDYSTKRFFQSIVRNRRLASLFDFENREGLFNGVHRSYKFCLLTLCGDIRRASYIFFATKTAHLRDERRRFELTRGDIQLMNPNTRTAPVFRSNADARIARKIYSNVPVLIDDNSSDAGNPWGIRFMRMFDMTNDSRLFRTYRQLAAIGARLEGGDWADTDGNTWVPLVEAKMIHQFDHRWATYDKDGKTSRLVTETEKANPRFKPLPRYYVPKAEVQKRLRTVGWNRGWLAGWRGIARATDERTLIATVLPQYGVGNSLSLLLCSDDIPTDMIALLIGNFSSLVLDFIARLKIGGANLNYFLIQQLPVVPPESYTRQDKEYLLPRICCLFNLTQFTKYSSPPHSFRNRELIGAEIDAYFARMYGLNIDDIRYIVDPTLVHEVNYPSESFRALKSRELNDYGEYRTMRLTLSAWDDLKRARPIKSFH